MDSRIFNKISPALWRSARFRGLSDKGKVAFLYFCTSTHVNSAGCYFLPDGYACADLGWDAETYLTVRAEVIAAGMIDYDVDHSFILVKLWFKHNPPTNDKHALGTARRLADVPSDRLRGEAQEALAEAEAARCARQAEEHAARLERQLEKSLSQKGPGAEPRNHLLETRFMQRNR